MSHLYSIHPINPQSRLIQQAASILTRGGLVVFPTDSGYCIGCRISDPAGVKCIRAIRDLDNSHNMSLLLPDLSELGKYVRIRTEHYRMIKTLFPGHYTFVLPATREIPKIMAHPKRRQIGIRIPDNVIALSLLAELEQPIIASTLILPDAEEPLAQAETIQDLLGKRVDLILDGGELIYHPSTVIDLCEDEPKIVRKGAGATVLFE